MSGSSGTLRLQILIDAIDRASRPMLGLQQRLARVASGILAVGAATQRLGAASGATVLAGTIGNVAGRAREAAGAVAGLAGRLALLAAGGGYAFNRMFIQGAAEAQDFRIRFEQLLGSAEAGQRRFAELQAFASRWGLPLGEIAQAGVALEILGRRGAAADRTLGAAADAAGTFGGTIAQAMEALASATRGEMDPIERYGIQARTEGNRIVMQWRENGRMIRATVDKNNPARIADAITRAWEGRGRGGREKLAQGWNGMLRRLSAEWSNFTLRVAENGPFDFLQQQLRELLAWIDRIKQDGSLERWAQETGAAITSAFRQIRDFVIGTDEAPGVIARLQAAFQSVWRILGPIVERFGGLETTMVAIGLVLGGPLISALFSLAGAMLAFGAALLLTPAGWFLAAAVAIGAVVYLIYKNWSSIVAFFTRIWDGVQAAWSRFLNSEQMQTAQAIFEGIASGIMAAWEPIAGFFRGLWDGIAGAFTAGWELIKPVVDLVVGAAERMASILPDRGSGRTAGGSGPLAPQGQGIRRRLYGPDAIDGEGGGGAVLPPANDVRVRAGIDVNLRLPEGMQAQVTQRGADDGMALFVHRGMMATP